MEEEKARILTEFFSNFMEETLRAAIQNGDQVKVPYNNTTAKRREEIDVEISRQAKQIGKRIVQKLDERGFSDRDPPTDVLEGIVREALKEIAPK
jgi:hypothetical protein